MANKINPSEDEEIFKVRQDGTIVRADENISDQPNETKRENPLAIFSFILISLAALATIITALLLSVGSQSHWDYESAMYGMIAVLSVAFVTLILSIVAVTLKQRTKTLAYISIIMSVILIGCSISMFFMYSNDREMAIKRYEQEHQR
jgi:NhaP-type Na+/H+ or K+/H+ antiporter